MIRRKPAYFRNALDLRDRVQVKVLRKRLKLSDEQFAGIVRKWQFDFGHRKRGYSDLPGKS
jgi:hypothetical protein